MSASKARKPRSGAKGQGPTKRRKHEQQESRDMSLGALLPRLQEALQAPAPELLASTPHTMLASMGRCFSAQFPRACPEAEFAARVLGGGAGTVLGEGPAGAAGASAGTAGI